MSHQFTLGQRTLRLVLGATVAGAALAMPAAHAAVVTVDFSGDPLSTVPFSLDGLYLNVVTGVASGTNVAGYDINPYFSGTGGASPAFRFFMPGTGGMVGAGGIATVLGAGDTVGPTSSFITSVVNANQTLVPATNYFGFSFLNESTAATNYGYIVVQQSANPAIAGSVQILGYSYEDAGAGITVAAAVPEPSSALMMVAGLLGAGAFGLHRRRKSA